MLEVYTLNTTVSENVQIVHSSCNTSLQSLSKFLLQPWDRFLGGCLRL